MTSFTRRPISSTLLSALTISAIGAGSAALCLTLGGCEQKTPAEKAVDDASDAVERAGEKVEDAADKAADAVRDAAK